LQDDKTPSEQIAGEQPAQPEVTSVGFEGGTTPPNASEMRMLAVAAAARYHGVDLDRSSMRLPPDSPPPSAALLVKWIRDSGLWARADRLSWRNLMKLASPAPVVLLFKDGSAGLLVGVNSQMNVVLLRDPRTPMGETPVPVDELRLSQVWDGEVLMLRQQRGVAEEDAPFNTAWLFNVVMRERKILRDVSLASIALSLLAVLPPLMVMTVVDRVVAHHSYSTLFMISAMVLVSIVYESLLGWARRELIQVISARLDAKLNLIVFNRLLGLSLDYFERNQAGQITHRLFQIYRVRDFITGKLLQTFLDIFTLIVLMPILFYLDATLAWIVMGASIAITLVIFAFLNPMRRAIGAVVMAETEKSVVLVETVHGIRTVKSLALEPQQRDMWDEKTANSVRLRLAAGRLANWPNSLVTPIEGFINRGVIMIGAYIALESGDNVAVGGLVAFMMLGGRVAQPLIGMARLMEDLEEVRAAIGQIASVVNNAPEVASTSAGLRPKFAGGITFDKVSFTYPGSKTVALNKISFSIPPGTMLGIVGRSGSGKSTIMRLLQGISREYEGYCKIDGVDLREINLAHLRRSYGVVLQDNFLFRGTVRDNITAGRPGLVLEDAVRAARLAGAEEFIERMPQGYETFIEEGSTNISGGQRQRLAIARAVICDPRILILDEATSALDPESEALVNANLQRIATGRTMVIVSHRLSSLTDCDQILVMDRGQVLDMAPHETLLERCDTYRTLWQQQNRHTTPRSARQGLAGPVLAQGDD
jgi:HlyB family type I secretion system ABC transporter